MKLNEAITVLYGAVVDTRIDVNIDTDRVQIHWCGVMELECSAATAAKVIPMLRQLETFGMKDC